MTAHDTAVKATRRRFRPKVTVGAVPGQLVARDTSATAEIRVIRYTARQYYDECVASAAELAQFPAITAHPKTKPHRAGSSTVSQQSSAPVANREVTWINIDRADDVEILKQLGKLFQLHPLALEDVTNVHQRAKLECYGDTLFFVARMPTGEDGFDTEQVSLFLLDGVVITIQERLGDCLDPVRTRIAESLGRIRKRGADYLAYAIIDAIIDGYFPMIERYAAELDSAADSLYSVDNRKLPMRLHEIRADLLMIRKVVLQHRTALTEILREGSDLIMADTSLYFRDCQDHIQQLIEAADTDRETCGELRELYFAMLGEKNNDVMKVLTIIATVFIPMSFVAGIYGMNFDSSVSDANMPELHWAFGYPFALGIMGILAGGLLFFLYRKGWLSH